ncbi:type IV pilin protein [Pseudaquabacterium rugosum]|uniref:Type IV pilin protein n=1 Tax=Pseudaquabacterium rugosum TaxID=2984194 RepID=A0ABU9BH19_9BURK
MIAHAIRPYRTTDALRPIVRSIPHGVTLLELLIAVVVVGIISAIAYPSFTGAIRKSRRADAMAALTQVMQAQERWRANNTTYHDDIATLTGAPTQSHPPPGELNGHYDISITSGSATSSGYTAVAQARSDSSQYADTNCRSLRVTMSGGGIPSYTSTNASGTTNSPDICWVK